MSETKYVLTDSSGSPLMRGDKVLLDKKCCEDNQVSMCVYYLRSECQGDGTFGHVFLHRTECVTMPEKDVPGWTDALKPGIWRSAGRNVIEVPLTESKECEKCAVETDADMDRLLALAPEIPEGLTCECSIFEYNQPSIPYGTLTFPLLEVQTVDELGEILATKSYTIAEYTDAERDLKTSPGEGKTKRMRWGRYAKLIECLDLTNEYMQFPPGDFENREYADRNYEKWFKGTLTGTVTPAGATTAQRFSIDIYAKRLHNYAGFTKREIRQMAEVVAFSNADETVPAFPNEGSIHLAPTYTSAGYGNTIQYRVLWFKSQADADGNTVVPLGVVNMTAVDTQSTTITKPNGYVVTGRDRFVSTSGAIGHLTVPDGSAGMAMAYWTPAEDNKPSLHSRVWRMPAITEDSVPPYDDYTWDKAPSETLTNPTKIPLFFGFACDICVTTDELSTYQKSVEEQYERAAQGDVSYELPGQLLVPLILQKCLERKYLYTTIWRDPDCSGDIAPGGYPFGTGLAAPDTQGHYGYRQVIDNVNEQAVTCVRSRYLKHEDEDTSYDENGNLLPIPVFRCYDENTDGHAYSRRELTYANFPQWCMDGCPSNVTLSELVDGVVPKPPTLLSDILINLFVNVFNEGACADPNPSYGWPNSFFFLCQSGLTTAKGQDRIVTGFDGHFFPWTSGMYKLEGGNDEPKILFSRKLELSKDASTTKWTSEPILLTTLVNEINGLLTEDDLGKAVYVCALVPTETQDVRDIIDPDTGEVDSTWEVKPSGFKDLYASDALKFPISAVGIPAISPDKAYTKRADDVNNRHSGDTIIVWTTVDGADAIYVKGTGPDTETVAYEGHICRNIYRSTMLVAFTFPYLQCLPGATTSTKRYDALSVLGHVLNIESLTAQRTEGVPLYNRWKRVSVDVSGSISLTSSDSYSIAGGPSSQRQVTAGASTFNYLFNITDGHSEHTTVNTTYISCPTLSSARITASQSFTTNYDDNDGSISGTATANGVTSIPISLRFEYDYENYERTPFVYVDESPGYSYLRRAAAQNWSGVVKTGTYYKDWDHPGMPNIQGLTPTGPGREHATCEYGDPYSLRGGVYCEALYKIDNAKQVDSAGGILAPGMTISGAWPEITISQKMKLVSTWHEESTDWYTDGKATEIWNVEIKIRDMDAS